MKNNANVNHRNQKGETPLLASCAYPHRNIAYRLLRKGAKVNRTNYKGQTPLHLSITHRSRELVFLLLKFNAKVNKTNDNGETPLALAELNGDINIVTLLKTKQFCVKLLGLLIAGLLLIPESYATYDKIECHECDRMADYCAFRCQWQPTYAKLYYCDDHCTRRNLACQFRCKRRNGQPLLVQNVPIARKIGGAATKRQPGRISEEDIKQYYQHRK
ncbi:unnamed protein product [Mytilus edulis]|uniref:Uncharacterized protein n=1 Tax=Mytilus edulis TaxID=6550 RepID=A0A8S3U4V3_MYTED|nr:unnamed protein product [Mytilus edulis]